MSKPHGLLRAGFPFHATLGMRRVTTNPIDLAILKDGTLLVLNRSYGLGAQIRKTNWDDEDLGTIGSGLEWPVQIIIDQQEQIYVTDEATNKIIIFDRDGNNIGSWGDYGSKPGEVNRPSGMSFDVDGNLLIADTLNHRISKFTPSGSYLTSFGKLGSEEGSFNMPWGLSVDNDDATIVVSDWGNNRIQKFDQDGNFMMSFGDTGPEFGGLSGPAGIEVDSDGDTYVADRGNHRILQYDASGRYVDRFIGDAVLSKSGRIYLMANARACRSREMTTLEESKRFRGPTSVRIYGDLMYVTDCGSHRIQVYKKEIYELSPSQILPDPGIPFLYNV